MSVRRFSFDLGTHSIGWAVFELSGAITESPTTRALLDTGVRIFDDSRDGTQTPLGEQRRGARSARRRRDRFIQRRQRVIAMLVDFGLLPNEANKRKRLSELDPYQLRAAALDQRLDPHELGRVLLHLNQRRGFKSNRKADGKDAREEQGKIATAAKVLSEKMSAAGARTLGEFLWQRHGGSDGKATPRTRQSVRIRLQGDGREALYDFYPTRAMLEAEFDGIMEAQADHHPALLSEDRVALIRKEMFFQRPLKAPQRGRCTFVEGEERLPRALPAAEARIAYEAVNHLRYGSGLTPKTKLTADQRDTIVAELLAGKNVTEAKLRKITGAAADARFQIAAGNTNGLKDYIAESAKKLGSKERFGAAWHKLEMAEKDTVVRRLIGDDDDDTVHAWLVKTYELDDDAAHAVVSTPFRAGTANLGSTANDAIVRELRCDDVPTYSEAVKRAGEALGEDWHHSDLDDPEQLAELPYYAKVLSRQVMPGTNAKGDDPDEARYGRIANPTVHRCLRQLQKLVNALSRKHGTPTQIVIEVARDLKLGEKAKNEHRRTNKANRKAQDARRSELEGDGINVSADALLRLRLFEEQARANDGVCLCPYSLNVIERSDLFSDAIEVDHILPYSRTLDDSAANKVVCHRAANREKRQQSPYEAFSAEGIWDAVMTRAKALPANKRWRFGEDAMQRFDDKERGFAERQLNETRYISRLARAYLMPLTGKGGIYVTTGQLTAMLRRRWQLNAILKGDNTPDDEPQRKVRDDHRHHAVDAIVVGAIDRRLLNEMAKRAGEFEGDGINWRITDAAPEEPFQGYRESATRLVRGIVVSRKLEHGKGGKLHKDSAYGFVRDAAEANEIGNLVLRKPLTTLSAEEIGSIRDQRLRSELQTVTAPFVDEKGKLIDKKAFEAALAQFSSERGVAGREQGVRRVRIGKAQKDFIEISRQETGEVYKSLIAGENHHMDIVQLRDGSWQAFPATRFEVNQPGWRPEWERQRVGGKLVMRLHKGDVIAVLEGDNLRYMSVHRLSPSNNVVYLAQHFEGGQLGKRHDDSADMFRWDFASIGSLKARNARAVHIDILGQVHNRRSNI